MRCLDILNACVIPSIVPHHCTRYDIRVLANFPAKNHIISVEIFFRIGMGLKEQLGCDFFERRGETLEHFWRSNFFFVSMVSCVFVQFF